jgi:hypothetical protein
LDEIEKLSFLKLELSDAVILATKSTGIFPTAVSGDPSTIWKYTIQSLNIPLEVPLNQFQGSH